MAFHDGAASEERRQISLREPHSTDLYNLLISLHLITVAFLNVMNR